MVMGRDSRSEGRGFESRHRILDGHFFTYICCKNCNVCLKRPKINEKEAGIGPLFLKKKLTKKFTHNRGCGGGGLVVSVVSFYCDDQGLNLAGVCL